MSHSRWEDVQRHTDPQLHNVQLAYVDGYLLALEDTLNDIRMILQEVTSPEMRSKVIDVQRKVIQTQRSARLTKKKLLERGTMKFVCEPCKDGKHPDCPGGTYCDCGHREKVEREPGT